VINLCGETRFGLPDEVGLTQQSLAVDLAQELDITLVGFLRDNRFNIYTAPERIDLKS
jgi:hypothetical protein